MRRMQYVDVNWCQVPLPHSAYKYNGAIQLWSDGSTGSIDPGCQWHVRILCVGLHAVLVALTTVLSPGRRLDSSKIAKENGHIGEA